MELLTTHFVAQSQKARLGSVPLAWLFLSNSRQLIRSRLKQYRSLKSLKLQTLRSFKRKASQLTLIKSALRLKSQLTMLKRTAVTSRPASDLNLRLLNSKGPTAWLAFFILWDPQ